MPLAERGTDDAVEALPPAERRRRARVEQIRSVAWELARRDGIAAISLRELADRVDMRQPSLYNYFPSKAALYDAMFAAGFQQLLDEREQLVLDDDPLIALRQGCRHFIDFCVRDPTRYQLLFQHSIPGFHPSAESMAIAERALAFLQHWLERAGVTDPAGLDLMRALLLGVAGEQIANEPGGQRWVRWTDTLVEVTVDVIQRHATTRPSATTSSKRRNRG